MPDLEARPFFSVILPVFNGQKYLRQSVDSVIRQTCDNWELIIVDDASTDETPGMIREFTASDPHIRSIRNEININCGPSANRGIEIARGQWITRIDADDRYKPEYLAELFQAIRQRPGQDFFASAGVAVIDSEGRSIVSMALPPPKKIRRMLNAENYLCHPATSYPRALWEKVGGYPPVQPDIKDGGDDRALWNKFFKAGAGLVVLPKILVEYRVHFSNMSYTAGYGNREWIVSLYMKCGMLQNARDEILKTRSQEGRLKPKHRFYLFLTYWPSGLVRFLMWEVRPWIRFLMRRVRTRR